MSIRSAVRSVFVVATMLVLACRADGQQLGHIINPDLVRFVRAHYAPGRILLIGIDNDFGVMVRAGLSAATVDHYPSHWSHAVLMGPLRDPGDSNSVILYESTVRLVWGSGLIVNGVQEGGYSSTCTNDVEYACILDAGITTAEDDALVRCARAHIGDGSAGRISYPIGGLVGTLWALLTRTLNEPNVFDNPSAMQCSTYIRDCFRSIGHDFADAQTDLKNTTPETIYQSPRLVHIAEWNGSGEE